MAFLLVLAKAVIEVAMLALLGQFIVGIFDWGRRANKRRLPAVSNCSEPVHLGGAQGHAAASCSTRTFRLATLLLLVFGWVFCFDLASRFLRLKSGAGPRASSVQQVPGSSEA